MNAEGKPARCTESISPMSINDDAQKIRATVLSLVASAPALSSRIFNISNRLKSYKTITQKNIP
jgi:hypothetical protein